MFRYTPSVRKREKIVLKHDDFEPAYTTADDESKHMHECI